MRQLVFATANPNKILEVKDKLGAEYQFGSLADINCSVEIPETQATLEGNALQKAQFVADHYKVDCFAEDSGLEIDALDGLPGVDTAHYAGPQRDAVANMRKVLSELDGLSNRSARFRAVIALVRQGQPSITFEGIIEGRIAETMQGEGGFGYDPIFIPEGYQQSFAQLSSAVKRAKSHRSRAVDKLVAYLQSGHK